MLHSFDTFEELLKIWSGNDWLRNFTWFPKDGLPKEKVLNQAMPEEYMEKLMVSFIRSNYVAYLHMGNRYRDLN